MKLNKCLLHPTAEKGMSKTNDISNMTPEEYQKYLEKMKEKNAGAAGKIVLGTNGKPRDTISDGLKIFNDLQNEL